ncbi:hypothetical protein H6G89_16270 [Oscillatoria sp. FACHB-1407]|uniref:hypothetical protein n=1 Tax=Oscillatoria sp. FACHB-1407 TaxID=2692847 RepID=UPI0016827AAF|nr:hypothetical protein [Oscillatoria sp. FACHB-1407]MBD2462597.1 hypothetical protein [Oscillatoria sp. FACHB-1407]
MKLNQNALEKGALWCGLWGQSESQTIDFLTISKPPVLVITGNLGSLPSLKLKKLGETWGNFGMRSPPKV